MSSSAFGDFGPLTERRRAEKARQQQKRLMIAGGIVIIIIIIVCGVAFVYNGKSGKDKDGKGSSSKKGSSSSKGKSGSSSGGDDDEESSAAPMDLKAVSKTITILCKQTDFQVTCQESLSKAANASTTSPKDVVRTAVQVIGEAISQAFDRADLIMSNDPRVKAAVADCKEFFEYAKDELNRTLSGMDAKDSLTKQGYQLRVWLSAVIAHQETCIDGFPDGEFRTKVKDSFVKGKELTSNALALIEQASTFLAGIKIPEKRRLLAEEGEPVLGDDGIPEWVPDSERRVLKGGGFKNTMTPNVVVAKDGSGKFKTINEALAAMPKTYAGRCVPSMRMSVLHASSHAHVSCDVWPLLVLCLLS